MTRSLLRVSFWLESLAVAVLASTPASAMPAPEGAGESDFKRAALEVTAAGQAPAGVDLDRPLSGGEWRISYRFQGTWRTGNWDGSERISAAEARAEGPPYTQVPITRDTAMHVVGLDWAPHERVTLLVRLPIMSVDEVAIFGPPAEAKTHASGVGDLSFGVLLPFMRKGEQSTSVSLMFGAPTGSIRKADSTGQRLPYPMQPGSGSWTLSPGLNYTGRYEDLSWGGQVGAIFYLNDNSLDYEHSTRWHLTGWLGWSLGDWVSTSLRAEWNNFGNIGGIDAAQPFPFTSPAQDPTKQGGHRIDLGPGLNVLLPCCGGQRLALEAMFPVFQHLDGPQLGNSWVLNAAWRMSF